jgi:hypothetical protein
MSLKKERGVQMSIDQKAMIVKLHISAWKGRKKDDRVTAKTNLDHGAKDGAGVYHKHLLAKKHLASVQQAESAARAFHQRNTLPWKDGGDRLLPSKNFLRYNKGMRDLKQRFENAVAKFLNQYPSLVTDAKQVLGSMYQKTEYPNTTEIEDYFKFFTDIEPVPVADDFRVQLNELEVKKIKKEIEDRNIRDQKEANKDLWQRIYSGVKAMADGMSDETDATGKILKKGRVYDAYVNNLKSLAEILPDLNIDDDPNLNKMAKEVKDSLTQHTPGQLRKDATLKQDTAQKAQEIIDKMAGYTGLGGGVGNVQ